MQLYLNTDVIFIDEAGVKLWTNRTTGEPGEANERFELSMESELEISP